jgi:hypothetical protein
MIVIPDGRFEQNADDAAAARRKKIREKLLRNEEIKVTPSGRVDDKDQPDPNDPGIIVPEGKLASFHWYERDPELFQGEKEAMRTLFPQFNLEKLSDGKLSWFGTIESNLTSPPATWILQAVYENNHPDNNSYGGSIKVYSIEPDLKKLQQELEESIPHILTDSKSHIYLCTSGKDDFKASKEISTTCAGSIAWAVKWISGFELWMSGDISTENFSGHNF